MIGVEAITAPTTEQSVGLADNLVSNEDQIGEAHVPPTLPTGNITNSFTIYFRILFYYFVILR